MRVALLLCLMGGAAAGLLRADWRTTLRKGTTVPNEVLARTK